MNVKWERTTAMQMLSAPILLGRFLANARKVTMAVEKSVKVNLIQILFFLKESISVSLIAFLERMLSL